MRVLGKRLRIFLASFVIVGLQVFTPSVVHAGEAIDLCGPNTINTAIGCIGYGGDGPQQMAEFFLGWGLGIAGGVALILIVYAGFLIITSSGVPRRTQAGKELLTAAFSGLFLVIFSAFILRFIGQDVLNINGF